MKPPCSPGFFVLIGALAVAASYGAAWQHQETAALRTELEVMRLQRAELDQLRAENQRLRQKQIPANELEGLRADHAAIARLRGELATLKTPHGLNQRR
jgi:hypothetical protein